MDRNPKLPSFLWRDLPALVATGAPALFAVAHAPAVAGSAFDEEVVRVLGLAGHGMTRALDLLVAAPFLLLPLATKAYRAALASAFVGALVGYLLQGLGTRLLRATTPRAPAAPWLAAVGSLALTVSLPFQLEAMAPGGHVLGALLAILPLALLAWGRAGVALVVFAQALAFTHGFRIGLVALLAVAPGAALAPELLLGAKGAPVPWRRCCLAAAVGLSPLLLPLALATAAPTSLGDSLESSLRHASGRAGAFVDGLGGFVLVLALVGAGAAALAEKARPLAIGLTVLAVAGLAAPSAGEAAGPSRYGPLFLAGQGAVFLLGACAMRALAATVMKARLAFAEASAALMVLLFAALPARAADDAATALARRPVAATTLWDLAAWGFADPGTIVFVQNTRVATRLAAARASGSFRDDLFPLPLGSLSSADARRVLAKEPALAPFLRALLLVGQPDELALATAANARPVLLAFDPRWDKPLGRHLVPAGLFDRYEASAMAPSDRAPALDTFGRVFDRLVTATAPVPEADLRAVTVSLLRSRVLGLLAANDKDTMPRVLASLRRLEPADGLALEVERRLREPRGNLDVREVASAVTPRF